MTGVKQDVVGEVAGLVLASGMSRRFEGENKLLVPIRGVALVRRTVTAYLDAGLNPVLAVIGHDAEDVSSALSGLDVRLVYNPDFAQGQSRALVRGVRELPQDIAAAVIGVADQPLLSPDVIQHIVRAYWAVGALLVVPRYGHQRGNPVLFDRMLFPELVQVTGDQGGRSVLERHKHEIRWVDIAEPRVNLDLDTRAEYAQLVEELGGEL